MKIGTSTGEVIELTPPQQAEILASFPVAEEPLPPLTARQLRLGLVTNGFALDQVEATIAAIEDPERRAVAKIEWEYASQFVRAHRLIAQVGTALGLTEEQIDGMWAEAVVL